MNNSYRSFSAKDFFYSLQNTRILENAFDEWKEYRSQITDYVINNCDSNKTLAIFGAGRCNDIDLAKLSMHFSEITLIDFNEQSLKEALSQYKLDNNESLKIKIADFVGIKETDYINYISALYDDCNKTNINYNRTFSALNDLYHSAADHIVDFGNKIYDYVLVLNVHSQLNDTAEWIRSELAKQLPDSGKSTEIIFDKIANETDWIIRRFNDALIKSAKEKIIVGHEIGIVDSNIKFIHGAYNTYIDLKQREFDTELKTLTHKHFIWPYSEKRKIMYSILIKTFLINQSI